MSKIIRIICLLAFNKTKQLMSLHLRLTDHVALNYWLHASTKSVDILHDTDHMMQLSLLHDNQSLCLR